MTDMLTAKATAVMDRKVWRLREMICLKAIENSNIRMPPVNDFAFFLEV